MVITSFHTCGASESRFGALRAVKAGSRPLVRFISLRHEVVVVKGLSTEATVYSSIRLVRIAHGSA